MRNMTSDNQTTKPMTKPKTKTIRVTKEDIRYGDKSDAATCPVARAIKRCCGMSPWVTAGCISVGPDAQHYWVDTPRRAANWIHRFDDGKPVKPFSFRIRL